MKHIKMATPGYGRSSVVTQQEPQQMATPTDSQPPAAASAARHSPTATTAEDNDQEVLSHFVSSHALFALDSTIDQLANGLISLEVSNSTPNATFTNSSTASAATVNAPDVITPSRDAGGKEHRRRGSGSSRHSASSTDRQSEGHHSVKSRSSFGDGSAGYLPTDSSRTAIFPLKPGAQKSQSKYRKASNPTIDAATQDSTSVSSTRPTPTTSSMSAPAVTTIATSAGSTSSSPLPSDLTQPRRAASQASLHSFQTSSSGGTSSNRVKPNKSFALPSSGSSIRSGQSVTSSGNQMFAHNNQPQSIFAKPEHTRRPVTDLLPKFLRTKSSSISGPSGTSTSSSTNNPYLIVRRESTVSNSSVVTSSKFPKGVGRRPSAPASGGGSMAVLGAALATSQAWSPAGFPSNAQHRSSVSGGSGAQRRPSGYSPSIVSADDRQSLMGGRGNNNLFLPTLEGNAEDNVLTIDTSTEAWVKANQMTVDTADVGQVKAPTLRQDVFAVNPRTT
ncbi:hypothetical protein OIO90_002237 [Microbotryomycetes sp. JL221]|nr:hypothetical protein OIO90_002237 [Microbotryomycetes sp. JL221]